MLSEKKLIIIINKTDQSTAKEQEDLKSKLKIEETEELLFISAKEKA